MARKSKNRAADAKPSRGEDHTVEERVQELTWALLDECATEEDMALLDNLLLSDASARQSYIECIQLHTDLMVHHAAPPSDDNKDTKSPVLGFLGQQAPAGFPAAEELK